MFSRPRKDPFLLKGLWLGRYGPPSSSMISHLHKTQVTVDLNAYLLCARPVTCGGSLWSKNLTTFKIRETIRGKSDKNHKKVDVSQGEKD